MMCPQLTLLEQCAALAAQGASVEEMSEQLMLTEKMVTWLTKNDGFVLIVDKYKREHGQASV